MSNFYVDVFDNLLSDKHSPICLQLNFTQSQVNASVSSASTTVHENVPRTFVRTKWDSELSTRYRESFNQEDVASLNDELDNLDTTIVNQGTIDNLTKKLCQIQLNTAIDLGMTKEVTYRGHKKKNSINTKAWFNKDCEKLRSEYFKVKNKYKKSKSEEDRLKLKIKSKHYKILINKTKKKFDRELHSKLRNLKSNKPKEYWDLLNKASSSKESLNNITTEIFKDHFEKLSNKPEDGDENNTFDPRKYDNTVNEEINKPFTREEIHYQTRKLKNNKSAGVDLIINEFLKYSPEAVITVAVKLFNLVLETGFIPTEWTIGVIKPIYKQKGSKEDPDNYRGITLLSCLGKLFTAIINTRLTAYLEAAGILGDEQAGFREGYSTLDHIFVLHSIIDLYLQKKKRVYCAFIDYKKAFDLVDRASLWSKLISNGINGKVVTVIYNMYANAKSCVSNGQDKSDLFNCNIGVRQGENLSPLLFAIYLNDFEYFISRKYKGLDYLASEFKTYLSDDDVEVFLRMFALLYADDTIVMAETETELQSALNAVYDYCNTWYLTVNASKTKVVIFSRGKISRYPAFHFGNDDIEVVDDYIYLGTCFNYNNKFSKAKNKQVNQARRAMFSLIAKARKLNLPIDIQMELFDQLVTPVLLYGSEVWGFEDLSHVETFHLKFCKQLLRVNKGTPNCMVYGELGRSSLNRVVESRMINFWCRITSSKPSKLSHIMYRLLKTLFDKNVYRSPWITKIKSILDNTGMSNLWQYGVNVSNSTLKLGMNQRLFDINLQMWNTEKEANGRCLSYNIFKNVFQAEDYLTKLDPAERIYLCKFRCGNHRLPINTGRFLNVDRDCRLCNLCNSTRVGDEFHYLFECPAMLTERNMYLKPYYRTRPNMFKMDQLFNCKNTTEISNLAKLCRHIMLKF